MRNTLFAACALVAALTAIAAAQTTGAGSQPAAPKAAAAATAPDHAFAREAALGGLAEVELGQLAAKNAESADVKQFGERMVTDHSRANDELKQLAEKQQLKLPTELSAKHKNLRDKLMKLNGAEFDKAYMSEMVKDHQQDVAKFREESKTGKNEELKAWAAKTLPTLEEHLKLARETASKVGATTGAAKKPTGVPKKPSGQ